MRGGVDLNRIQIFKEVVQSGSFSKAAATLKQPKSRISRNIAALERETGVQLIYRTTRQFQLTEAGRALFNRALAPLNDLTDALEQLRSQSEEVAGTLRVTVPEDVGVALMGTLCAEFQMTHPQVTIELLLSNSVVDLVKESIDVAIRIGRLKDSSMKHRKVGNVRMVFVVSDSFLEKHGSIERLSDLEELPFLSFATSRPKTETVRVTKGKETKTLKLNTHFVCNNHFVLRGMALQGAGLALLPEFILTEQFPLVRVFKDWQVEGAPIQVVMPQQREAPPRVSRFVDFIVRRLSSRFS